MRLKLGFITLGLAAILAVGSITGVAVGSPTKRAGLGPIQAAANKTSKAGTFQIAFTVTIKGKGLPASGATISGTGAFNTRHQIGKFKLDIGSLAALAGATGAAIPSTIEGVLVGGVIYLKVPSLAAQLGKGKEWIKVDPKTLPKSTTGGIDPGTVKTDPAALAKLASSVSVHKVGTATVRGSKTTKYRATIDVSKVVASLPAAQQASAKKSFTQLGLTKVPVDVYVDGHGYVRRVALNVGFASGSQGKVAVVVVTDIYGFGTKVNATAPPAAKTADAGPLLAQLLGGLTGK